MYEKQLKQLNPTIPHITYDISVSGLICMMVQAAWPGIFMSVYTRACCVFGGGKCVTEVKWNREHFSRNDSTNPPFLRLFPFSPT